MDTTNSKSAVQTSQLITLEKGKELNLNYNTQTPLRLTANGADDANAVWYSLEDLENYINYIKNEGVQKGYTVDGIRFYIGKYSAAEANGRAGYTTIFLSPTGSPVGQTNSTSQGSKDITTIKPLNFGSMGNPPKMIYGL
jgi:hypothetical protein